jgi:hypothetical protein
VEQEGPEILKVQNKIAQQILLSCGLCTCAKSLRTLTIWQSITAQAPVHCLNIAIQAPGASAWGIKTLSAPLALWAGEHLLQLLAIVDVLHHFHLAGFADTLTL